MIIFRLSTLMSIIVFSLGWKYGILISMTIMNTAFFIIPSLAIMFNRVSINQSADRSALFIPVPSFKHQEFAEDAAKGKMKNRMARMINKLVAMIITLAVVFSQFLVQKELIPFPQQDLW